MRAAIQKSTGKLIEYQSHAKEGTVTANAIAAGYEVDDIEEREITEAEAQALLATANAPPVAEQIDKVRDARLAAGYADTTTGKTWQCDPLSMTKWTALAAKAGLLIATNANGTVLQLIAADNTIIQLSPAETYALLGTRVFGWVEATMIYARQLKDQVLAGNPPADINAGWPVS